MILSNRLITPVAKLLTPIILFVSLHSSMGHAAMISTEEVVAEQRHQWKRSQISSLFEKQRAIETLEALGLDQETVMERVERMTESELLAFNQQVEQHQAGAGIVGVVVLVFVVLILLDLLGTTNVFPAIKPINS